MSEQSERISFLSKMLNEYDDGRSKSFYCIAAALLLVKHIEKSIEQASEETDIKDRAKTLRAALQEYADIEGIKLALSK